MLQYYSLCLLQESHHLHFCNTQGRGRGANRREQDSPGIEAYYRHSMVENPWKELEEKYKDRIQQD